jgi:tRNA(fMet)-specific endonuclease VapC
MIILDTDHMSELQYPNSVRGARLLGRLSAVEDSQLATTIVTYEEQMRGWLASINKQPAGISRVEAYTSLLSANLRDFRQIPGLAVEDWLAGG